MLSKNRCKDSDFCSNYKDFALFLLVKSANNYDFTLIRNGGLGIRNEELNF